MTEDAFDLTPHDVRGQEFQRAVRGYDRREVEDFKERLADEIERLMRERAQLEERSDNLSEQLRTFREREHAMNEALLAAQQLRADVEAQATRDAEAKVREAEAESTRLVVEASREETLIHERMAEAQRQFARYVTNLRSLLERQMGEVEGLEAHISATPLPEAEAPLERQA
jgi:DivIVA domain-containing protein